MKSFDMLWPGGKKKALTFSYDDGVVQDKRLIAIMRENGIRGTFNLNSGFMGWKDSLIRDDRVVEHSHIPAEEISSVYEGFEVAVHTVYHYEAVALPSDLLLREIIKDREAIESLVGYPVKGMAYPFWGTDDARVQELVKACGIRFARGVNDSHSFKLPVSPWNWSCSCHHSCMEEMISPFLADDGELKLFSVWGHSYEFDQRDDWDKIEDQLKRLGGRDDVWYATNSQVFAYLEAYERLEFTLDGKTVLNPSAAPVWILHNGEPVCIKAGEMVHLGARELDTKEEHPFRIWKG